MTTIPLSNGDAAIVDDAYSFLSQYHWYNSSGYAYARIGGMRVAMHSMVLGMPIHRNMLPDHINRNRLDNRRENLRFVTRRENLFNSDRLDRLKPDMYVYYRPKHASWFVCVGKTYVGTYKSKESAIRARNRVLSAK